jgi:hypothetical protein
MASASADAQTRGVFGAEVFVDDDDGKVEAHGIQSSNGDPPQRVEE